MKPRRTMSCTEFESAESPEERWESSSETKTTPAEAGVEVCVSIITPFAYRNGFAKDPRGEVPVLVGLRERRLVAALPNLLREAIADLAWRFGCALHDTQLHWLRTASSANWHPARARVSFQSWRSADKIAG